MMIQVSSIYFTVVKILRYERFSTTHCASSGTIVTVPSLPSSISFFLKARLASSRDYVIVRVILQIFQTHYTSLKFTFFSKVRCLPVPRIIAWFFLPLRRASPPAPLSPLYFLVIVYPSRKTYEWFHSFSKFSVSYQSICICIHFHHGSYIAEIIYSSDAVFFFFWGNLSLLLLHFSLFFIYLPLIFSISTLVFFFKKNIPLIFLIFFLCWVYLTRTPLSSYVFSDLLPSYYFWNIPDPLPFSLEKISFLESLKYFF